MRLAAAVIWSKIKTWVHEAFMKPDELAPALEDHLCSREQLEFALAYLEHYGYGRHMRRGLGPRALLNAMARWFQASAGITVDGVIGPETLGAMAAPRCGLPDHMVGEHVRWRRNSLGLYVESYVPILSRDDQDGLIELACRDWSGHADVSFRRVSSKSAADVYVQAVPLDGPGNVLAQAQLPPGDDRPLFLQMDSRESAWVKALQGRRGEILFRNVFAHELGHNLGLGHSGSSGSRNVPPATPLMAPRYNPQVVGPLPDDDVPRIVALYGPARTPPEPPPPQPPAPTPTPGGKKMTREALKAWIANMAKLVASVSRWMLGPLAPLKPHLATLGEFLAALADNDLLLDFLLLLVNRGQMKLDLKADGVEQLKADVAALTE